MLGVMRGAVKVGAVFGRLRRHVHVGVVDTDSTPDVQIITPLVDFFSKRRSCKSHIPFSSLDVNCRKDYVENGGGVVICIFAAEEVARQFGLAIAACDRQAMHESVRNRVLGRNKMLNMAANIGDVTLAAGMLWRLW